MWTHQAKLKLASNIGGWGEDSLNTKSSILEANDRPPFSRRIRSNIGAYKGSLLRAFQFSFSVPTKPTCGTAVLQHGSRSAESLLLHKQYPSLVSCSPAAGTGPAVQSVQCLQPRNRASITGRGKELLILPYRPYWILDQHSLLFQRDRGQVLWGKAGEA